MRSGVKVSVPSVATGGGNAQPAGAPSESTMVDLDKRLQWFEARLNAAFRQPNAAFTLKHSSEIRKLFDDDDTRRDVTSFCESEACRLLVAFAVTGSGGSNSVRLTASTADPDLHRSPKILCFRKLTSTAQQGASQSIATAQGAPSITAASTAASTAPPAAAAAAVAISREKISHENIHRLVSFFECKPHMLGVLAKLVDVVIHPLTTVASSVAPLSTSQSAGPNNRNGRNSVSSAFVLPPSWGGVQVKSAYCPPPVRHSIELELDDISQSALVAGGVVEGRTQLPKLMNQSALDEQPSLAVSKQQTGTFGRAADQPSGMWKQPSAVTFSDRPSSNKFSAAANSAEMAELHLAEQTAGNWLQQLRSFLQDDSPLGMNEKKQMSSGSAYRFLPILPLEEAQYWRCRLQDVEHLAAQLKSAPFNDTLATLKQHNSRYYENLMSVKLQTEDEQRDVRIINRWLTPIVPYFESISLQCAAHLEFTALVRERTFVEVFHLMFLLWRHCPSPKYPSGSRLASIIAGLAEYVVVHATHYVSLDMYFLSDPDETKRRIRAVFDVTGAFKTAFFEFKAKISQVHAATLSGGVDDGLAEAASSAGYLDRGEWRASTQQIFAHVDLFVERLNDVMELIELRGLVDWVGQLSISSVEAEPLRLTVQHVAESFRAALVIFSRDALEHIDRRSEVFDRMLKKELLVTAIEMLKRFGVEVVRNVQEGPFGVNLVSRTHLLQRVMCHPALRGYQDKCLKSLWQRWAEEIRTVQQIHVNNQYETFLSPHVPSVAKSVIFSLAVFRRLFELQVAMRKVFDETYVDQESEELQEALLVYNATCQRVGQAFETAFRAWCSSLCDVIARLNSPILCRDTFTKRYRSSLDHHVTDALRGVGMIVSVLSHPVVKETFAHLVVPQEAITVLQLKASLWHRFTVLHSTVESYYDCIKSIEPHERGILQFELTSTEALFKRGLEELTWEDEEKIDAYNEEVAEAVTRVEHLVEVIRGPWLAIGTLIDHLKEDETNLIPLRTSKVGDRAMPLDEFQKKYEEHVKSKRRATLQSAMQMLQALPLATITLVNDEKTKWGQITALLSETSAAFRQYVVTISMKFWSRLNDFAARCLENLQKQMDVQWLAQNGGVPLIEGRFSVMATSGTSAAVTITPDLKNVVKPFVQKLLSDPVNLIQQVMNSAVCGRKTLPETSNVQGQQRKSLSGGASNSFLGRMRRLSSVENIDDSSRGPASLTATGVSRSLDPPPDTTPNTPFGSTPLLFIDPPPEPKSAEERLDQWTCAVLQSLTFSLDGRLTLLQRQADLAMADTMNQGVIIALPLAPFERLWSPHVFRIATQQLSNGKEPVYGSSIEGIKGEIRSIKELAEQAHQLPNFTVCQGWIRVDCRGIKHTITSNAMAMTKFFLDHALHKTQSTIDETTLFIQQALRDMENGTASSLEKESQHALKRFFQLLRTIKKRYEDDSAMFLPMSQALRLLSAFDHVSKTDVQWMSERIEALQPLWEQMHVKMLAVRGQLSSIQDLEMAAMRRSATALLQRLGDEYTQLRRGCLYSPATVETDENSCLVIGGPTYAALPVVVTPPGGDKDELDSSNGSIRSREDESADDRVREMMTHESSPVATLMRNSTAVYAKLDHALRHWTLHRQALAQFQELQELFEMTPTKFSVVSDTISELTLLKQLWDLTISVNFQVAEWMTTPFFEVDSGALIEECRKFASAYGQMPSLCRQWRVFVIAETQVDNLMSSFPLIADLRSTALRPRHWAELSLLTSFSEGSDHQGSLATPNSASKLQRLFSFSNRSPTNNSPKEVALLDPASKTFTLGTLLKLNLHDHVDTVRKLVERAEKELTIERNLEKITSYWKSATLPFVMGPGAISSKQVLGPTDEIVEWLDDHLSSLQNILNSRWADVFRKTAQQWQFDLQFMESAVSCWSDVQKSLVSLFPIFARSEDLRASMPDEVSEFDDAATLFFEICSLISEMLQQLAPAQTGKAIDHSTPSRRRETVVTIIRNAAVRCNLRDIIVTPEGMTSVAPRAAPSPFADDETDVTFADENLRGGVQSSPPVNLLVALEKIEAVLSMCEKRLGGFLETKRRRFPRFFFVSDVDLVDILSKEYHPPSVCLHINQLMSSVDRVEFDPLRPDSTIIALYSVEGERLVLSVPVECGGRQVEQWLDDLMLTAQVAVRESISLANQAYLETPRTEWMFRHTAQAVLVVARAHWTSETSVALEQVENGSLSAMGDHSAHLRAQLNRTVESILRDIDPLQRKLLISLITIDVHARDVVSDLIQKRVDSTVSFAWQSQLRFYFHNDLEDKKRESRRRRKSKLPHAATKVSFTSQGSDDEDVVDNNDDEFGATHAVHRCMIHICDTSFEHGLDYTGNCGCLVITPLTDRCYITLTQALKLSKGGAPAGPAGTGKTETVKDIAHAMGKPVYVFNCSDQMDVVSVANIFKGLAMSGAWGCFDEFNRIAVEVLSVVSAQVKSLFDARRRKANTFSILGDDLPFSSTVGVFVTMNPGYKGRTELPENVKSLFRPCAMVVPDIANIAEIMLSAEGFSDSKILAKKFVRLYELSADVLSPEPHYDWGLRAIRAVLLIAGGLKRQQPTHNEHALLMKALRDANTAKLRTGDIHMFDRLLAALFPGVEATATKSVALDECIQEVMADNYFSLGTGSLILRKTSQLYDMMNVRHSIFIMGSTGSGKSSMIDIARRSFEKFSRKRIHSETFDPKSLTALELYGFVHPFSREWRDGVLSRAFRDFATNHTRYHNSFMQWIILDGAIDADWIESMNSVMDENKLLTLVNNERIPMTASMRLVFEVSNLDHATPATVSRAGIVYINRTDVGWVSMKDRWMAFQPEKARLILDPLFDKHVDKFMTFVQINALTIVPLNNVALLRSLCNLLDALLKRPEFKEMGTTTMHHNYEKIFLWACVWTFGSALPAHSGNTDCRQVFSTFTRREFPAVKFPDGIGSLFELDIQMNHHAREVEWVPWVAMYRPRDGAPQINAGNRPGVPGSFSGSLSSALISAAPWDVRIVDDL